MNTATLLELKRELNTLEPERVRDLCLRLAKYEKESKELLTYLLFEAHHEATYIENVKNDIDESFRGLSKVNLYFVKKNLRRILRMTNRQIKYSGLKQTEVELRIYFCTRVKKSVANLERSQVLMNLYQNQLRKINTALATLTEDLRFDYERELQALKTGFT